MFTTTVHYEIKKNRYIIIPTPSSTSYCHTATWRDPLVKYWRKVIFQPDLKSFKPLDSATIESRIWQYLLLESTLLSNFNKPIHNLEGSLTQQAFQQILSFSPGLIPKTLIPPVINEANLSYDEQVKLKYICQDFFSNSNTNLNNPSSYLEEALVAMSFKEKYGMSYYSDISEMHHKAYLVYRMVSNYSAEAQDLTARQQANRQQAIKLSGIQQS